MLKLVAHEGEVHEVVELPKDVAFWDEPVIEVLIFAYLELLVFLSQTSQLLNR